MKRQTLVEYEEASPEVQEIYNEIMETTGAPTVLNFLKALGQNEKVLRAVWSMLKYTIIEGEIPALLKQLILFRISIVAGNQYCTALHGHAVLNMDPTLTYDDLIAMSEGKDIVQMPLNTASDPITVGQSPVDPPALSIMISPHRGLHDPECGS